MTIFEVPEVGNENFKLLVKLTSLSFSDFNFERNNITVKEWIHAIPGILLKTLYLQIPTQDQIALITDWHIGLWVKAVITASFSKIRVFTPNAVKGYTSAIENMFIGLYPGHWTYSRVFTHVSADPRWIFIQEYLG
jgi:hypothetical protein